MGSDYLPFHVGNCFDAPLAPIVMEGEVGVGDKRRFGPLVGELTADQFAILVQLYPLGIAEYNNLTVLAYPLIRDVDHGTS